MNTKISNKITIINYIMTLCIVCLHSLCLYNDKILQFWSNYIRTIGDMAVPTFFAISSFLLFRQEKKEEYFVKIKKRLKTLVIPYLIWSIIFYFLYLIISKVPYISTKLNNNYVQFSVKNMLTSIAFCKYIPQFWYIRILFFMVLISYFMEYMMKKGWKIVTLIIIIVLIIINYIFDFPTVNVLTWLPLFWGIAWITFFYEKNIYEILNNENIVVGIFGLIIIFIMSYFVSKNDIYSKIYYTWRIISPFLIIVTLKNVIGNINIKWRYKQSFYIFALHYFILSFTRKILQLILGTSFEMVVVTYCLTIILTIILALMISKIIKKFFPKFDKLLSGNRGG